WTEPSAGARVRRGQEHGPRGAARRRPSSTRTPRAPSRPGAGDCVCREVDATRPFAPRGGSTGAGDRVRREADATRPFAPAGGSAGAVDAAVADLDAGLVAVAVAAQTAALARRARVRVVGAVAGARARVLGAV